MGRSYSIDKKDSNEREIVEFYQNVPGVSICSGQHPTAGFDRLVERNGKISLVEIKDLKKAGKFYYLKDKNGKFVLDGKKKRIKIFFKSELEMAEYLMTENEKKTRKKFRDSYHLVWDIETAKKAVGL